MAKSTSVFDFLTEDEQEAIKMIAGSPLMLEALRKILTDQIIYQGVHNGKEPSHMARNWVFGLDQTTGGVMTDDQFGRAVRVHVEALVLVEQAVSYIKGLAPVPKTTEPTNPAV